MALIAGMAQTGAQTTTPPVMDAWLASQPVANSDERQAAPAEADSEGYEALREAQQRVREAEDRARVAAAGE
ncbi:hypothetical protein D3C78_1573800 [compost metagenome]